MMIRPGDYEVRQRALDIRKSFIVKAPAGSGKTTLLIKRYLKLLTTVNHPEEVIAITFTRKAAGELISRVMSALTMPDDEAESNFDSELLEIARSLKQTDQSQGWNLSVNPSRLRIMTIDALCHSIVRQMPWSAGFGAAPSNVSDDASQLYLQAASQALIKALSSDGQTAIAGNVLAALDNDFSRTCELIKAMLAKRDQWHGFISEHKGENARQQLQANWNYIAGHLLENCMRKIEPEDQQELLELGQYSATNLSLSDAKNSICELKNLAEFPKANVEQIAGWKAMAELLMRKKNDRYIFRSSSSLTFCHFHSSLQRQNKLANRYE